MACKLDVVSVSSWFTKSKRAIIWFKINVLWNVFTPVYLSVVNYASLLALYVPPTHDKHSQQYSIDCKNVSPKGLCLSWVRNVWFQGQCVCCEWYNTTLNALIPSAIFSLTLTRMSPTAWRMDLLSLSKAKEETNINHSYTVLFPFSRETLGRGKTRAGEMKM